MPWSRARAAATMVLVTALWSTAGVVSRQLESAQSFEVTFWRSLFTVASLLLILRWTQGPGVLPRLLHAPRLLWLSALCWACMFTFFMVAITLMRVAEVLLAMALGPLVSALIARLFFKQRIARATWVAIALAGVGMAWMFAEPGSHTAPLWATLMTLLLPLSGALNWSVVQHAQARGETVDMMPAVMLGAALSALATLTLAWPLQASWHDVRLLAGLGLFQLALPCALAVACARVLPAPEMSLLALLEVLFGILLAWGLAGEVPSARLLSGGSLVLLALLLNVWWTRPRTEV